jgi:thioredoxin 1
MEREKTMEDTIRSARQALGEISQGVALVDFNAPWCGPCRAMDPILEGLEKAYSGRARVMKVNVDENRDMAMGLGVQSIPTLLIFKEGREIERFVGIQSARTLAEALNIALAA